MKKLKLVILRILLIIPAIILSIGCFVLISFIQTKLFLPQEYLMWIFKFPASRLIFIYEFYIIYGLLYMSDNNFRQLINFENNFLKKHKKCFLSTFIIFNIVLLYTILFNVSVITKDKIINYTFLNPKGKYYSYNDIIKINTGVYGKKLYLPYTHSKGDFYYIIELKDGTKIDLADSGGNNGEEDYRFILEKLDAQYVNMGIPKISSTDNFEFTTTHLDKIYTDKIQSILKNVK